ncbi:ParB/RepB/Spo0J family partition protein [Tranquillimonas alkanivorans]|uniref:Chromosome partitioning protein, ParB family n=1 Tax=Tranquillimonas alkanivorans TaxID=441119 RepID=A0A1I5QB74_9RHOB|nr:ParB N-terminal domain-containing protein [Tranquillimonas alkanivorans]SFP43532.1 chromosome partitioning protein, ParB family [Tranquillimonas alkanivorans]
MSGDNKFRIGPIDSSTAARRRRTPGPMGAAVRETAESLSEATETKIEQRRRNAEDARAWREARESGLVLAALRVDDVATDDLPRDRLELDAIAVSDEMEELKASIRARGQKEPIEVYEAPDGKYQLKKGWRRLTALSQLRAETGEDRFERVIARVEGTVSDRVDRYIDMVEENVVRQDLTFAEMAQLAITAAEDDSVDGDDAEAMVNRLYGSLHKMKRSYIRSFVHLLLALGEDLRWPREVSRNLGVDVARALKAGQGDVEDLRGRLAGCSDAGAQSEVLGSFLKRLNAPEPVGRGVQVPRQKYEFHLGPTKVTARMGECRIVSGRDFTNVPREKLERAIKAFEAELERNG